MFVHLVSIWKNSTGSKIKVWQTAKEGYSYEIDGDKKSNFYGPYEKLEADLKKRGYKLVTNEDASETFMNNVLSEATKKQASLESGGKKSISAANIKLSPEAVAALNVKPENKKELVAIKAELKKHSEEYAKLNALLNKARLKRDALEKKQASLETKLSPMHAKYFSLIDKECSEFIQHIKAAKKFLFRGTDSNAKAFYGKPHEKRNPIDTSVTTQKAVDVILSSAGFKALRSNSIFTTGNEGQAENYGQIYFVFPKNGYSFTWSSKHDDWVPSSKQLEPYLTGFSIASPLENEMKENAKMLEKFSNKMDMEMSSLESYIEDLLDYESENGASAAASRVKLIRKFLKDGNTLSVDEIIKIVKRLSKDNKFRNLEGFENIESSMVDVQGEIRDLSSDRDDEYYEENLQDIINNFNVSLNSLQKEISNVVSMKQKYNLDLKYDDNIVKKIMMMKRVSITNAKSPIDNVTVTKQKAKEFIMKHGFSDKDMTAALKSEHEIYINSEYIALDHDTFNKALHRYYLNKILNDAY